MCRISWFLFFQFAFALVCWSLAGTLASASGVFLVFVGGSLLHIRIRRTKGAVDKNLADRVYYLLAGLGVIVFFYADSLRQQEAQILLEVSNQLEDVREMKTVEIFVAALEENSEMILFQVEESLDRFNNSIDKAIARDAIAACDAATPEVIDWIIQVPETRLEEIQNAIDVRRCLSLSTMASGSIELAVPRMRNTTDLLEHISHLQNISIRISGIEVGMQSVLNHGVDQDRFLLKEELAIRIQDQQAKVLTALEEQRENALSNLSRFEAGMMSLGLTFWPFILITLLALKLVRRSS